MSERAREILDEVLSLTADERREFLDDLIAQIKADPDSGVDEAWHTEIARRIADIDAGRAALIPQEQAERRIFGALDEGA